MSVKIGMLHRIKEFIGDDMTDPEWFLDHMTVDLDDQTKTVKITIDNISWQEYPYIRDEA